MTGAAGSAVDFRILGPVEAARDGRPIPLGGPRQRTLLALLLVEAGRPVSVDSLTEELWAGAPPAGGAKALRVYVSRLRTALGDDRIVARPPGYVLEAGEEQVDARRFEQLLADGRGALARGAAGLAAERLDAALALWRGPALGDVAHDGVLARQAQRLDELRLDCREELAEAELALGRHAELVPELERLVVEEPLRERLWRHLILALYRSGRQAEALDAYRRARTLLTDELGLEPGDELRELERAVLRHEVEEAPAAEARHNLPARVTSFVGRERELADLEQLLRGHRLVTVTGMGGAGKTSLALETARAQTGAWTDGVWLVDLLALSDPGAVPAAVARVLGFTVRADAPAAAALAEQLRPAELLLVLDNCEHLADACAELASQLLATAPHVRLLATSRVTLGAPGELDYALEPLGVPEAEAAPGDLGEAASVRLFLERGRAARRGLVVDDERLRTVAHICRELDGLPLAIELAAARAKALSVDEIAELLADRFRFLRSWGRVADPRQQTLRATLDWSYDLLAAPERDLLDRLSVFAGGFTLDAVAAVCLGGDEAGAVDGVGRLVECSLVVADERGRTTRYRLLETIREYAAERLAAAGSADDVRDAYAAHFHGVAEATRPDLPRLSWERQKGALAVLDTEQDNIHAALAWALDAGSELALPFAVSLRWYWNLRGFRRQGVEWLERALALPNPGDPRRRAEAHAAAALLARIAGDFARAETHAGDAVAGGRSAGSPLAVTTGLNVLVTLAGRDGDVDRARSLSRQSVALCREAGSPRGEAIALYIFAEAAADGGRLDEAREAGDEALDLARVENDPEVLSIVLGQVGLIAAHEGRLDDAREHLLEALGHVLAAGFLGFGPACADGLALVAAERGDLARATRLVGAADTMRRLSDATVRPIEAVARDTALAAAGAALGSEELEAELERGRRLTLDELAHEARGVPVAVL
ncbi:MAG TPA: BTAD domain-containing putative transcriptional regulator [Gaiellaceae bacterium]|nr:BTAD domain-containing putative transcriptional regulator [Gaiellaceae bacterium]